jgi:transcriptional regulator with XRE-family HTH domain
MATCSNSAGGVADSEHPIRKSVPSALLQLDLDTAQASRRPISKRKNIFLDKAGGFTYYFARGGFILPDKTSVVIGERLNRARESMGLTLQQLARLSEVAPSTIQKIEAGTMMPSVAVMMKIARGLHKKIGFFLDEEESSAEVALMRRRDRAKAGLHEDDFSVHSLSSELGNPEMDGFILSLPPGGNSGDEPLHHRGDELAYCIRGRVSFTINGRHYKLGAGDSLHFKSELPHSWKNSGRSKAEVIIICSLPALSEKSMVRGSTTGRKRRR